MCFGSSNNAAAQAANNQTILMEQHQAEHDNNVAAGKASIDNAFAQFDQPYFDNYAKTYRDTYNPQLDDQYGVAKDQMIARLAGTDQLGGSVGNNDTARLNKTYNDTQADIANKSVDAENAFKASVDNSKSNLYALNTQAADPLTVASEAQSTAGSIVSPQSYPQLSNVFGDALSGVATAAKTNATAKNPISNQLSNWFAPLGSGGSSVVSS